MLRAAQLVNGGVKAKQMTDEQTLSVIAESGMSWHAFKFFSANLRFYGHSGIFAPLEKVVALSQSKNTSVAEHSIQDFWWGKKNSRTRDAQGGLTTLCSWEVATKLIKLAFDEGRYEVGIYEGKFILYISRQRRYCTEMVFAIN
jgi:hypothetical protein